ncbi:MAG: L-ribulose-5-phosphate 4-epimerase AraD [Prevotellaceae bacterium]|jgi:L-ribulose-5-phosphate 4-epimerase|nr:L-ribulose-5-phosphate 4-epimerase AraD [Prevotellaceae bacterium]
MFELKEEVFKANLELVERKLVLFTFGSASAIDRTKGIIVIKPTGIVYEKMRPGDMVMVDLNGQIIDGKLKPSRDVTIHLAIYRNFPEVGGIAHTRSIAATSWAQAGKGIPVLGTTHADFFNGEIPCTRKLTEAEVTGNYEEEIGKTIVERFEELNPMELPAVLVYSRGPISWGVSVAEAVRNATVLEEIAKMAIKTTTINPTFSIQKELLTKHFNRSRNKERL